MRDRALSLQNEAGKTLKSLGVLKGIDVRTPDIRSRTASRGGPLELYRGLDQSFRGLEQSFRGGHELFQTREQQVVLRPLPRSVFDGVPEIPGRYR